MRKAIIIIILVLVLDQVFKVWVKLNMTLGGEITVHSEIGTGTSFSLVFPIAKNQVLEEENG